MLLVTLVVVIGICLAKSTENCPKRCDNRYEPICAQSTLTKRQYTFNNECQLNWSICNQWNEKYKVMGKGSCKSFFKKKNPPSETGTKSRPLLTLFDMRPWTYVPNKNFKTVVQEMVAKPFDDLVQPYDYSYYESKLRGIPPAQPAIGTPSEDEDLPQLLSPHLNLLDTINEPVTFPPELLGNVEQRTKWYEENFGINNDPSQVLNEEQFGVDDDEDDDIEDRTQTKHLIPGGGHIVLLKHLSESKNKRLRKNAQRLDQRPIPVTIFTDQNPFKEKADGGIDIAPLIKLQADKDEEEEAEGITEEQNAHKRKRRARMNKWCNETKAKKLRNESKAEPFIEHNS